MDYEKTIKENAEIRVHKDQMFAVEYKNNSEQKGWEVYLMYAHPATAIELAKKISAVIHKIPIIDFKVIYDYD